MDESLRLMEAGAIPEAMAVAEGLRLDPQQGADALHVLGVLAAHQGENERALELMGQAVAADPENLERKFNFGTLALDLGSTDLAVETLTEVVSALPEDPAVHSVYGNALTKTGRHQEAVNAQERALTLAPNHPLLWSNLANAYLAWGKLEAADAGHSHAVKLAPEEPELLYNYGGTRFRLGQLDDAIEAFEKCLELEPKHARARTSLGVTRRLVGQLEVGRAEQEKAYADDPNDIDVRWNLALTHLFHGDWASGWQHYESRRERAPQLGREGFGIPWDGSPTQETVVIEREQGLGDTLMFARFLAAARDRVGKLVFRSHERLTPLLKESLQIEGIEIEPFQREPWTGLYAPLMSLPHLLGMGPLLSPIDVPYLQVPEARIEAWSQRLGPRTRPRIGLVWQGNPGYHRDGGRSIPLERFQPLLEQEDFEIWSLQSVHGLEQLEALDSESRPRPLPGSADADGAFLDTAAVMMNLDLIVSIDSAPIHLAGALGRPAALLLSAFPDWRWGQGVKAWYPTVEVFSSPSPGHWDPAIRDLLRHLGERYGPA